MASLDVEEHWRTIRRVFAASFSSSLHFAIATIGEDGEPCVTPIGSVVLTDPGKGFYFEVYPTRLPRNVEKDARVAILGVNSGRWFWLKSLFLGRFVAPPAVRLRGRVVGEPRAPTTAERELFLRRVRPLRRLRGYKLLWSEFSHVRDLEIDSAEPVVIGAMTRGLWKRPPSTVA
jgi:hypothetical protein